MRQKAKVGDIMRPAGGWGSFKAVASILTQEEVALLGSEILLKQNKPERLHVRELLLGQAGRSHHAFEFCENGAKATAVGNHRQER